MKTYIIVDASINHKDLGFISKKNIVYYEDGKEIGKELYMINDKIVGQINPSYFEHPK